MEKHLRLSLDFRVTISEITEQSVHDYYGDYLNYQEIVLDPETWEGMERQRRLLWALVADRRVLDEYLAFSVACAIDPSIGSNLREYFRLGEKGRAIIEQVFSRLAPEDERYFRGADGEDGFWGRVELLDASFKVEWVRGELSEVRPVREA